MEIAEHLYNWLNQAGIPDFTAEVQESGKFLLGEKASQSLENGISIVHLIKRLYQIQNRLERLQTPSPDINTLKNAYQPAAKLYNWNVLVKVLSSMNIHVHPDTKSLIVAGDRDMIIEVLDQIFDAEQTAIGQIQSSRKNKAKMAPDGALFIESVDPQKDLEEVDSCLEFLIVSLSRNFKLRPKQAAGLLTQSGKYLAHVIGKGLRGQKEPVINWYQEIHQKVEKLVNLIEKEEQNGSIQLVLGSLRPGFIAKSLDTVHWCCRVFSKLGAEFTEKDLLPGAWDWFVSEGGGIDGCIISCKRHSHSVVPQITSVLVQFARYHFLELFSVQLRNILPESIHYMTTINELLSSLCQIRLAKQEITTGGVLEFWFNFSIREADSSNQRPADVRIAGINFVCDLWILFPNKLEQQEDLAMEILSVLKRALRDSGTCLRVSTLAKMFQLLNVFSVERNPYAPVIYKTLTFALIENYGDIELREFILSNFMLLFATISNIPVPILLEPLTKQLKVLVNPEYNVEDFNFFAMISQHPKLQIRNAIQLIDVQSKIIIEDFNFSGAAEIVFLILAKRFANSDPMQAFLEKFVDISIKVLINLMVSSRVGNQNTFTIEEMKNNKIHKQKVDSLVQLIVKIIKIWQKELNEVIKNHLLDGNFAYKKIKGSDNINFTKVLDLFGDSSQLVKEHEELQKPEMVSQPIIQPEVITDDSNTFEKQKSLIFESPKFPLRIEKSLLSNRSSSSKSILSALYTKPKGRAMYDIQMAKRKRLEKEIEERIRKEYEQKTLQRRKQGLRKQLEQRKIELGVEKQVKQIEEEQAPILDRVVIEIKDLSKESEQDKEEVNIVLRRYLRALKFLFKKYSSSGFKGYQVQKETFDHIANRNQTLGESEFYKLLKEQGITTAYLTLDEFRELLKSYAKEYQKSNTRLEFQHFLNMIAQVAFFIFSRPPVDLSNLPLGISVKKLFDIFRQNAYYNGQGTRIYDEPDPGAGDIDVVKRLNRLLQQNPQAQMPDGYRKVVEKDLAIKYTATNIGLNEKQQISVEIMDELLSNLFGFHILEPSVKVSQVYRAQGVLGRPTLARGLTGSHRSLPNMNTGQIDPLLSPEIKYQMTLLQGQYERYHLSETAHLLEDLLYSVEIGESRLVQQKQIKPQNKIQQIRLRRESESRVQEEQRERKRQLRRQILKRQLTEGRLKKAEEVKQQRKVQKIQERERSQSIKRREEKQRKDRERRLIEARSKRQQREQEEKQLKKAKELEQQQKERQMMEKRKIQREKRQQELRQWKLKKEEEDQKKRIEEMQKQQEIAERRKKETMAFIKKKKGKR